MAVTVAQEKDPLGGNVVLEGSSVFRRYRITGDGASGNADIAVGANQRVKSVKIIPGNVVVAGFAVTLAPTAGVDVRVAVPAGLGANQYAFVDVELSNF